MNCFVTLHLYCLICFVTCFALPTDINFSEKQPDAAGIKIARNEDHRIADNGEGCPIRYETRFEIQEIENVRIDCREWTETRCTTKTRPNCHHRHEIKCDTEYKEKCRNYVEQQCIDNWRTVCETTSNIVCKIQQKEIEVPYEEDECTTRQERRCEKHWEESSEGRKVWVDNPATCKLFDSTDCHSVTKYRKEYLADDVCHDVPVETCKQVKDTQCHDVPQTKCTKEPYQNCKDITVETCEQESWEDCQDYPRKQCKDIHEKIPKQVTIQVPVHDCHSRNAEKIHGNGVLDYEISNGLDNIVFKDTKIDPHINNGIIA